MRAVYASGRIGRDPTKGLRRPKVRAGERDGRVGPNQVPTRAEVLAIAANKVPGIRAAVCHDTHVARQSVEHDDVNVLCIGAWIIGPLIAEDVIGTFLAARFGTGDDVRRRVQQLRQIEKRHAQGTWGSGADSPVDADTEGE